MSGIPCTAGSFTKEAVMMLYTTFSTMDELFWTWLTRDWNSLTACKSNLVELLLWVAEKLKQVVKLSISLALLHGILVCMSTSDIVSTAATHADCVAM